MVEYLVGEQELQQIGLGPKKLRGLDEIRRERNAERYDGHAAGLGRRKMPDHPNSMKNPDCPNTTRFRLQKKKPGAKICTVGGLSSAQTFVHPPFLQGGERGG